ncbi:MAG: oxidoreductase [Candidatus Solibacter sp.]|nr:oxidoreductase [Candidatus Solibacter sp.]
MPTRISRRSLLARAAAGAVVYRAAGRPAHAQTKAGVALGFIGSGIRGKGLIDEFKEVPGVRGIMVADIYDGCLQRAKEQLGPSIQTTRDYRRVLDNKDIQAVVIATPDHLHLQMVLDALSAGKHVYCEKPLTWTHSEGRKIIEAVNKSGKLLQVGSQGKTTTLVAKAREIITSGKLGKVNMVRLSEHRNNAEGAWIYPVPPDASEKTIDWPRFIGNSPMKPFDAKVFFRWRCWWEYSGGVATDLFVHQFTTLHEMLAVQRPASAASFGGIMKWNDGRTVPDVMQSVLQYPEGFIVDLYVNLANGSSRGRGIWVMGSEGTLQMTGEAVTVYPEPLFSDKQFYGSDYMPKAMRDAYLKSFDGKPETQTRPEQVIKVERGPTHNALFIDALVNGRKSPESAEEGHNAASAAHLVNAAYRDNRRATWEDLDLA